MIAVAGENREKTNILVHMSASLTVWLSGVVLIVFGQQWSSVTQRRKIHQMHRQHLLDDTFIVGFGLHLGLVIWNITRLNILKTILMNMMM